LNPNAGKVTSASDFGGAGCRVRCTCQLDAWRATMKTREFRKNYQPKGVGGGMTGRSSKKCRETNGGDIVVERLKSELGRQPPSRTLRADSAP
jgi:hypothetical protein